MTVDRQMKRYQRAAPGVHQQDGPHRRERRSVVAQVRDKLGADAVLMQLPIGKEDNFEGVIDLITMKANYFDGSNGEKVREEEIPAELKDAAEAARQAMLEALSMYSDELMETAAGRRSQSPKT